MQKKTQSILVLGLAVILLAAGCNKSTNTSRTGPQPKVQTPEAATNSPDNKAQQISLSVLGVGEVSGVKFFPVEGKNALEILKSSYTVTTKTFSGLGEYVDGINGVKADSKHFWSFYVNGKSSDVGASTYVPKAGDSMEWKLEQIK